MGTTDPPGPGQRVTRFGSYDGVEVWTVRVWDATTPRARVLTSLHERLHHELQSTTLWGLVTRFAHDYRSAGVWPAVANAIFWIGVLRSQQVHETYATTLAVGLDAEYAELLDENPDHRAHYERGLGLIGPTAETWGVDRFIIDASLRACMTSGSLTAVADALPYVRITDFDAPSARPDDRLARLQQVDLRPLRTRIGEPPRTVGELRDFHDVVAAHLCRAGLDTPSASEHREAVVALVEHARRLLPELTIELDEDRADPVQDDLEELQRERIELHEDPLPVEVVDVAEVGRRPKDFLREHPEVGVHVLAVWMRADLLARQFARPNALDGRSDHVLAVQAAGRDGHDRPVVRLAIVEGLPDVSLLGMVWSNIEVLYLTTTASIDDAPDDASFRGRQTLFVLADQPIYEQLRHTFGRDARLRWARGSVGGDRSLAVFVYEVDRLPGTVYLHLATETGAHALARWLATQNEGEAIRAQEVLADREAEVDAVAQHIVSAWWRLHQLGARRE